MVIIAVIHPRRGADESLAGGRGIGGESTGGGVWVAASPDASPPPHHSGRGVCGVWRCGGVVSAVCVAGTAC